MNKVWRRRSNCRREKQEGAKGEEKEQRPQEQRAQGSRSRATHETLRKGRLFKLRFWFLTVVFNFTLLRFELKVICISPTLFNGPRSTSRITTPSSTAYSK